jgi:hypothetical protein
MRILHGAWRRVQLQREIYVRRLLIDSGIVKALTYVDPEGSLA